MTVRNLQITTTRIVEPGGNPVYKICQNNPRRVWITINTLAIAGSGFLCIGSDGGIDTVFDQLLFNVALTYLRYDLGTLVTGEIYFTDGTGKTPNCTLVVTEGILL